MSIFWLRIALGFYGVGLLYALFAISRSSDLLNRIALHASYLGMIFHFVSLTEGVLLTGHLSMAMVHNSESLLAFLIMKRKQCNCHPERRWRRGYAPKRVEGALTCLG